MSKNKIIKTLKALPLLIAAFAPVLNAVPVLAASGSMSLTGGTATKGSNITVSIKVNSGGEPINAAGATITYPTDKLSYVSGSNSSAFPIAASNSGGGGTARVDRGAFSPVSGSQTVAFVTFRALVDSGSATLGLTNTKVVSANDSSDLAISASGTTINFKAPTVAAPADTTPPTITQVTVATSTADSATITWVTSEPATSEVLYGVNNGYGLSAADSAKVTAHTMVLKSPFIVPASTFHFMVRSIDPAGNAATSPDGTFSTTGATLVVKVIDQKKKPAVGAVVEFDGKKGTTDKNGVATIKDVGLGKKYGVIRYKGHEFAVSTEVKDATTPQNVTFTVKVPVNYVNIVIILALILIAVAYLIGRGSGHGPTHSTLLGLGMLRDKIPLPRLFKKRFSDFVTVKDISPADSSPEEGSNFKK